MKIPVTLTIAGSDSGGGAGIQADLKTFHAFSTFGTAAVTAITAQNTLGVTAIHPIPTEIVRAQIAAVATDLRPRACKSGMLATRELVHAVADAIVEHELADYVLDPVMVATSGARLLEADAEQSVLGRLVPLARIVTPNLDEAAILVGFDVSGPDEMRTAARAIVRMGARAALVKGGHMAASELVDILYDGKEWTEWRRPKLATRSTHGTGCTLSAGIAAGLAHGRPLRVAVEDALEYVQRALLSAPGLGGGSGPINHLVPAPPASPPQ